MWFPCTITAVYALCITRYHRGLVIQERVNQQWWIWRKLVKKGNSRRRYKPEDRMNKERRTQGWRPGSVVKSTGCSYRGPRGSSQPPVTLVPVWSAPAPGMSWCTYIYSGKTFLHIKWSLKISQYMEETVWKVKTKQVSTLKKQGWCLIWEQRDWRQT